MKSLLFSLLFALCSLPLQAQSRPLGILIASRDAFISGRAALPNQTVFVGDKVEVRANGIAVLKLPGRPLAVFGEGVHIVGRMTEDKKAKNPVAIGAVAGHVNRHACEHAASPSVPAIACEEN